MSLFFHCFSIDSEFQAPSESAPLCCSRFHIATFNRAHRILHARVRGTAAPCLHENEIVLFSKNEKILKTGSQLPHNPVNPARLISSAGVQGRQPPVCMKMRLSSSLKTRRFSKHVVNNLSAPINPARLTSHVGGSGRCNPPVCMYP